MSSVFAHLILDVQSVEDSVGFYRDRLGFTVRSVGELDGHRLAAIWANGFEILLLQQPPEEGLPVIDRGHGLILNFQVADLPQLASRLKSHHVHVLRDIDDAARGERTLLIADPDGYAILFSEPAGTIH
jgi:catechol 2,3-dioxygenase-like lactoylglutathione lyase family enzyme